MSAKRTQKSYDNEFKAQAVKLAQEIGGHKTAKELGVPDGTIYCWIKAFKEGRLSANEAVHSPKSALSLNDELIELRKRVKEQDKEIRRLKEEIGLNHKPKRKPNGITKADKKARKSDDLIKRDFTAEKPLEKCVTDMTEIKAADGKLYVSAIFDCYDLAVLGLAMDTNMKATLCEQTLENAAKAYPALRGAILHSDRGTQYTSDYTVKQSINMAFCKA